MWQQGALRPERALSVPATVPRVVPSGRKMENQQNASRSELKIKM
jgi:hypothetical protein